MRLAADLGLRLIVSLHFSAAAFLNEMGLLRRRAGCENVVVGFRSGSFPNRAIQKSAAIEERRSLRESAARAMAQEFCMTSIYVGNLSYTATEDDLRGAFAEYGEVSSVNIVMDRETGRPRGFAFVEMPDKNQANEAIKQLNLREISGRSITVNEARPKTDRPRRSGGGSRNRW